MSGNPAPLLDFQPFPSKSFKAVGTALYGGCLLRFALQGRVGALTQQLAGGVPGFPGLLERPTGIRPQGQALLLADIGRLRREVVVPWAGFEPAAFPLGGGRSILLSYQGDT